MPFVSMQVQLCKYASAGAHTSKHVSMHVRLPYRIAGLSVPVWQYVSM